MSSLVRNIEKDDLPLIEDALFKVFNDEKYKSIDRLGGMTNHSYKVVRNDNESYLVRIPGEGTEEMINRADEKISTELACRLKIDSELLYFDANGTKVMKFINEPQPMNEYVLKEECNLIQAANIFRRLHKCGEDTGVRFDVFEMAALYESIIKKEGVDLYFDYNTVKKTVIDIKNAIDATFNEGETPKVPCHNDSLVDNWVLDGNGKLYLIDWEYSGMNDAMWDLSCLSIEANYGNEHDEQLLNAYYERPATVAEKKRFLSGKIYVDYLWSLWGLTRVPFDGVFMQTYADERYDRLKRNIDAYMLV